MCSLFTEYRETKQKTFYINGFIGDYEKSKKRADSCDLCARDIVDYCNSTDWVQLNQPSKDIDSLEEVKVNLILKNPSR